MLNIIIYLMLFTTENTEQAQIFLLIFEKSLTRIIYTYLTLEKVCEQHIYHSTKIHILSILELVTELSELDAQLLDIIIFVDGVDVKHPNYKMSQIYN